MRILITSLFYSPFNSIASFRVTNYADILRAKGHDVKVICRYFSPDKINVSDLSIGSQESDQINDTYVREGDVIYTAFSTSNSILKKGKLLPTGIKGYYYLKHIDAFHYSYVENGFKAFEKEFAQEKFDIILASSPPLATNLLAEKISKKYNIKWVPDFRDSPVLDEDGGFIRKVKIKGINKLLGSASGMIFVSPGMKDINRSFYIQKNKDKPFEIVYNGFHKSTSQVDENIISEFNRIKSQHTITLLYTGSIYAERNLDFFLKAIGSYVPETAVVLLGVQEDFKVRMLQDYPNLNMYFFDKTTHATSMALQKLANALLLTIWKDSYTGFSGKVFEYLYAQNHIILDHPPAQDLQEFLEPFPNHYCMQSDPNKLKDILEKIQLSPQKAAPELLQSIERTAQVDKLERFLKEVSSKAL